MILVSNTHARMHARPHGQGKHNNERNKKHAHILVGPCNLPSLSLRLFTIAKKNNNEKKKEMSCS